MLLISKPETGTVKTLFLSSEFFNTLRWLNGDRYPDKEFNDLWTNVTFNQFHDILPGSAINEANKEAIARYTEVLRKTNELRNNAFRKMADEIKFQTGIGQPVVAYNLQPVSRTAVVEANIYSHEEPVTAKLASWGDYYGSKNVAAVSKGGNCHSFGSGSRCIRKELSCPDCLGKIHTSGIYNESSVYCR